LRKDLAQGRDLRSPLRDQAEQHLFICRRSIWIEGKRLTPDSRELLGAISPVAEEGDCHDGNSFAVGRVIEAVKLGLGGG
jgi:hypothetical protein